MSVIQSQTFTADSRVVLRCFQPRDAPLVASWIGDALEAFWIAPQTRPPLTAATICGWTSPGRQQFVLTQGWAAVAVAYGELNLLNGGRREYWLGHLIVDPLERGRGVGRRLVRSLLQHAFEVQWARRVSLIVFPENVHAIRCYERAGMRRDGIEVHDFSAYGRRIGMIRMCAGAAGRADS